MNSIRRTVHGNFQANTITTNRLSVKNNVELPPGAVSTSSINNSSIQSGFVDAVESIQTAVNTLRNTKQNTLQFDQYPTENSPNILSSGNVFTSLASKADAINVVHKTNVNETIDGIKTFLNTPKVGINNIATIQDINNAAAALINGAPETADTLRELSDLINNNDSAIDNLLTIVGSKANTSDVVFNTGNQTISGNKTFSGDVVVTAPSQLTTPTIVIGGQSTSGIDSQPLSGSNNLVRSGGVHSHLNTSYQPKLVVGTNLDSAPTTSSNPITSSAVKTINDTLNTLSSNVTSNYQLRLVVGTNLDNAPTTSSNPITSSAVKTINDSLTTLSSSAVTLAGSQTISGDKEMTGRASFARIRELVTVTTFSTTTTVSYTGSNGVLAGAAPSANFAITFTSMPTGATPYVYNFVLILNTTTNKRYCNAFKIETGGTLTQLQATAATFTITGNTAIQQISLYYNGSTFSGFTNIINGFVNMT